MSAARVICAVTGSRAEYGLLRPVMRAIADDPALDLRVVVAGAHLLPPAATVDEVTADFDVAGIIPMQQPGAWSRQAEAAALGRGVSGFADWLGRHQVDVAVVLGDRIEAFAAAAAAAVAGIRVAHLHGGDRAEGIADEALRHAITKLAHIHLPATEGSARRIAAMGEDPKRIHVVGSPAIDGLAGVPPLPKADYEELGRPEIIFILHPSGLPAARERDHACELLRVCRRAGRVLALHPNHDPGREAIVGAITQSDCPHRAHLTRDTFIGLLDRVRLLVGNSSAGLIECAARGVRCINVGTRQAGREMPDNVIDVPRWGPGRLEAAISRGLTGPPGRVDHPYGDGRAGRRTAGLLASFEPGEHPLTKLNAY